MLSDHFAQSESIAAALSRPGALWVTDADGTLWSGDVGDDFLRVLIADGALRSPPAVYDLFSAYEARVAADPADGYAWAVQLMAGMAEAEVAERAAGFARRYLPPRRLDGMATLVAAALRHGTAVHVVSASNSWVVRAAVDLLGLPSARVSGVEVAVEGGLLTDRIIPPVTYRGGKVAVLGGRRPTLASGDSLGDLELLRTAELALVVRQPSTTTAGVLAEAEARGWLVHDPRAVGAAR